MSTGIPLARVEGEVTRQAHADLPEGTFEREVGREGFFGPATQFYHRHAPTGWTAIEGSIRPRAFHTNQLAHGQGSDPFEAAPLLKNAHLECRWLRLTVSMPDLARNADGDDLLFLHEGRAELYCDYGHLSLAEGDYVILPRGTMWRLECEGPVQALLVEATGNRYRLPDRGLLGQHALFDPAVLEAPRIDEAFRAQQDESEWRVVVKARGRLSKLVYPFNPLDAVGWKGDQTVLRLNWRDIRPVVSPRYHLPPSAHTTFVADRFVICTFCPRPLETDPGALKLPFYHSNDDYDEVIFYHQGQFTSREGIGSGAVTLHPAGCTHGPHPRALEAALLGSRVETDEVAVMIDARDPLDVCLEAEAAEIPDYAMSWSPR